MGCVAAFETQEIAFATEEALAGVAVALGAAEVAGWSAAEQRLADATGGIHPSAAGAVYPPAAGAVYPPAAGAGRHLTAPRTGGMAALTQVRGRILAGED